MLKKHFLILLSLIIIFTITACNPNNETQNSKNINSSQDETKKQEDKKVENNQTIPGLVTFQIHQEEFEFLGIENVVTENADFGAFWNNFFNLGGYDNIDPYAVDSLDTNIWYTNEAGEKIYFQGKMVKNVDKVAKGYTLKKFPAGDYFVLTHEWQPTFPEAQQYIGFGRKYIDTVQIPDGYVRNDGSGCPITEIERDNANTPDGSRIEHWLPIKKG